MSHGWHPIDVLGEWVDEPPYSFDGCAEIANSEVLTGRVVNVDLEGEASPNRWIRFIETYAEALRHSEDHRRSPRFILSIDASRIERLPEEEVHVSLRLWENLIRPVDTRCTAERSATAGASGASVKQQLKVEITTRLALWDLGLAASLVQEPLKVLCNPADWLREYARNSSLNTDCEPCWEQGTRGQFFGEDQVHSAVCAVRNDDDELCRRIWAGQVSVMFPYLEARLQDLLERTEDMLPPFMPVENGTRKKIKQQSDYEFSEVCKALKEEPRAPDGLTRHARTLKRCRNKLAHHEVITEADVRSCLSGSFRRLLNEV